MPDSAITDAVRDQLFNRLGLLLGVTRTMDILEQFLSPVALDQVKANIVGNDDETGVRILALEATRFNPRSGAGAGIFDADVDGLTYGRIVDGGGGTGHRIQFWNDQARTTLVAQTPATVNDNTTGTFTAQAGFFRCASSRSRTEARVPPSPRSGRADTSAGGGGGGVPKMFSSSHFPRSTGEVRLG